MGLFLDSFFEEWASEDADFGHAVFGRIDLWGEAPAVGNLHAVIGVRGCFRGCSRG